MLLSKNRASTEVNNDDPNKRTACASSARNRDHADNDGIRFRVAAGTEREYAGYNLDRRTYDCPDSGRRVAANEDKRANHGPDHDPLNRPDDFRDTIADGTTERVDPSASAERAP